MFTQPKKLNSGIPSARALVVWWTWTQNSTTTLLLPCSYFQTISAKYIAPVYPRLMSTCQSTFYNAPRARCWFHWFPWETANGLAGQGINFAWVLFWPLRGKRWATDKTSSTSVKWGHYVERKRVYVYDSEGGKEISPLFNLEVPPARKRLSRLTSWRIIVGTQPPLGNTTKWRVEEWL